MVQFSGLSAKNRRAFASHPKFNVFNITFFFTTFYISSVGTFTKSLEFCVKFKGHGKF